MVEYEKVSEHSQHFEELRSGMREFRVSQEQIEIQSKKQLKRSLPTIFIAALIGIMIGIQKSGTFQVYILIPAVLIVGGAIFLGLKISGNPVKNALSSIKIELTDNSIKKYQSNAPTVEIQKLEAVQITENSNKGITIKTGQPNKNILIPVFIDDYSEIRDALANWMNITVR